MFQSGKVWFAWWGAVLRKMSEYVDILLAKSHNSFQVVPKKVQKFFCGEEMSECSWSLRARKLAWPTQLPSFATEPCHNPIAWAQFCHHMELCGWKSKKVVTLCLPGQLCNSSSLCLHRVQQSSDSSKKANRSTGAIISLSMLKPVVHCCSNWSGRAQWLSS